MPDSHSLGMPQVTAVDRQFDTHTPARIILVKPGDHKHASLGGVTDGHPLSALIKMVVENNILNRSGD
jgi:hypothetical protein